MIEPVRLPQGAFPRTGKPAWSGATKSASPTWKSCSTARVHASLPNDYFSLHRVVTLGQPLGAEGELGKAIEMLAQRSVRRRSVELANQPPSARELKPATSRV